MPSLASLCPLVVHVHVGHSPHFSMTLVPLGWVAPMASYSTTLVPLGWVAPMALYSTTLVPLGWVCSCLESSSKHFGHGAVSQMPDHQCTDDLITLNHVLITSHHMYMYM